MPARGLSLYTMPSLYRFLATADHPIARAARAVYRAIVNFSLPAPRVVFLPILWLILSVRSSYYVLARVLVCEPMLKMYCSRYGKRLHTGVYLPFIMGRGDIVIGDDVLIGGKLDITFALRFAERPALHIGDRTGLGHLCSFSIAKRVTIGTDCRIAQGVWIFDSSGHPSDPEKRLASLPPSDADVSPVDIGNNVWIGTDSIIGPGVTIGDGAVVAAASVVLTSVPANTVVMGNPARRIASLQPAGSRAATAADLVAPAT